LIVKKVRPEYPADADVEGNVVLAATIGTDGTVVDVKPTSGDEKLIPNAITAAKQYKFKPFYLNGTALEMETTITISFEPPLFNVGPMMTPLVSAQPTEMEQRLIKKVAPEYPAQAHGKAEVVLDAVIGKNGKVASLNAVSGPRMFIQPALDAVREYV